MSSVKRTNHNKLDLYIHSNNTNPIKFKSNLDCSILLRMLEETHKTGQQFPITDYNPITLNQFYSKLINVEECLNFFLKS